MKPRWRLSFVRSPRSALTLIEVLVASAMLATILVTALTTFRSYRSQISRSADLIAATEGLDSLISGWFGGESIPAFPSEGILPVNARLVWHAEVTRQVVIKGTQPIVEAKVVRVRVVDPREKDRLVTEIELLISGSDPNEQR